MDPSGRIRRDLVAQLDSLRHRNAALFEAGGEPLRMDSLLGMGRYGRTDGRTRLSIIYTGFWATTKIFCSGCPSSCPRRCASASAIRNDELQAVVMFDEADLYIPANAKPATAEPCRACSNAPARLGSASCWPPSRRATSTTSRATRSPPGSSAACVRTRRCASSGPPSKAGRDLIPARSLPGQTVGEFHLVQEGLVRPMRAQKSLIVAEQVPFDRIEQLARETKGQDEKQLKLFA